MGGLTTLVRPGQYPRCLSSMTSACTRLGHPHHSACHPCLATALPPDPSSISSVVVYPKAEDYFASSDFGVQATPNGQPAEEGMGSGSNDGGLENNASSEKVADPGREELFLTWSQVVSIALVRC